MENLLEKAAKFLQDNPFINEVELVDSLGNKVRVVRNTPCVFSTPAYYWQGQPWQPAINPQTGMPY